MRATGARALAAVVLTVAVAPFVACGLDFDRYAPLDSESGAPPINIPQGPADVSSNNAVPDASKGDATDAPTGETTAPCSAPPNCFRQASSCGAACRQNYQMCARRCGDADTACLMPCTNTQQVCLGMCATSCIGCTQDAGCTSATNCLDAANR